MEDALRAKQQASPRLLGALFMALVLIMATGCSQDRAKAVDEMNKGIAAYQRGSTMEAIKHLKSADKLDPTYAKPALYLGQIYHQDMHELDNAEQAYREALGRAPKNAKAAYKLGAVLSDKKKPAEAASYLEQAAKIKPDYAKAWFRLGLAQEAQGKYPDAVDSFMKSIRANARMKMAKDDKGGQAYNALGDLYTRFGFYDKALKVYQNGILNNGKVAQLYAGRGVAQLRLKRFKDAEQSFEKALQLDSTDLSAKFNLAVVRNELGETDGAIKALHEYLDSAQDESRREAAQGMLMKLKESKKKAEK